MDHPEKNTMRKTIHNYTLQGDHALDKRKRLLRLRDEEENRNLVYDRQMLYVACTRAMHRLYVTHTGEISAYLPKDSLADAS